jgi:hypothetical protein
VRDYAVAKGDPGRREMLTVNAFDPASGDEIEVFISYERLRTLGTRSQGQVKEAAYILPQVLQAPAVVFEGFRREEDEDRRGVGWRCYCGVPDSSYTADGEKRPPRKGQVFLLVVNDEHVAYNWRWEQADADNPELPQNSGDRFKERLE